MRISDVNTALLAVLAMLIILLSNSMYIDFKLNAIESKIDTYFAPVEDIPLPEWEDKDGNV